MTPELALFCLLLPAMVALCWMLGSGIGAAVRRRRERAGEDCRRHVRIVLVTESGLVELCCTCDAGDVVAGRWQFAAAVEADHTIG